MYFEAENSPETPEETAETVADTEQPAPTEAAAPTSEPSSVDDPEVSEDLDEADDAEADDIAGDDNEADEDDAPSLDGAPETLVPALRARGFTALTDVQRAVANADDGRRDLRITSRTGSGKTVALGFALLADLQDPERAGPTTLVIAPTRELAMQVRDELAWLFADQPDMRCGVVTGGTNLDRERMRLARRPAVLVGTPGRLLDHIRRGGLDVSSVRQLVLDEADQMLDLGFKDELDAILAELPDERRTHLVSATFPPAVLELADRFQRDALEVFGSDPGEAHADIEHIACRVNARQHYEALVNLLLLTGDERTLVFVRTREETTRFADRLAADGFAAMPLNGDLAQAQRTRTLAAFRNGTVRTLVATDVAARGIDVPSVTTVVHAAPPIDTATYVHRSGRTGRAGEKGRSVLLVPKSRAARAQRMYRHAGVEARWAWPPTAATIREKQLARTLEAARTALTGAPAETPERRAAAAELLRERDPVEVVASLLARTSTSAREPFDLQVPIRVDDDRADARRLPPGQRGKPGAAPSWQGPVEREARTPEAGFTRFRINWGFREGANPRRILAHVCRRGDIQSNLVGSIELDADSSTFEVQSAVAGAFAKRVQRPDRRDPHLRIHRETFDRRSARAANKR